MRTCTRKDFEEVGDVKTYDDEEVPGSLICLESYDGITFNSTKSTPTKPNGL